MLGSEVDGGGLEVEDDGIVGSVVGVEVGGTAEEERGGEEEVEEDVEGKDVVPSGDVLDCKGAVELILVVV